MFRFKNISGSVFENSVAILLTRMSLSCSSLIITILIARRLGSDELGYFSIAMSLCTIMQFISMMGYDTIILREIAKDSMKGGRFIQHGVVLGVFSSVIGMVLMAIIGKMMNYTPVIMKSVYISSIVLLPAFLNVLCETVFIGLKKAKYAFFTAIIREFSWLLLSIMWMNEASGIYAVIWAFIVSRIIGAGFLFYFLNKQNMAWCEYFDWVDLKKVIKLIPSFVAINVLANVLLEADIIILSHFAPAADIGFYSVTKKILRVSFILIFSVVTAFIPIIVETIHRNPAMVYSCLRRYSFRVLLLSGGIAMVVYAFSRSIVMMTLGLGFMPSVILVHILIWKIIPLGLSFLWSRFLMASNHQNKDVFALSVVLPIFLVSSVLCVKKWGVVGMACADIASMSILAGLHLYFVNRWVLFKESRT